LWGCQRAALTRAREEPVTHETGFGIRDSGLGVLLWSSFALMAASVPEASASRPIIQPVVVIRSYNTFGVSHADLAAADVTADEILRAIGLETRWLDCGQATSPRDLAAACGAPLGANEFILRILESTVDVESGDVPLGTSIVDVRTGAGVMSTVYPDRVARVAAGAGVDSPRLLGRAIAHELGHLLQQKAEHSAGGIMRARWSRHELQRDEVADWRFNESDAARIRARVQER
jgi:hypothetical protein